ncbi:protein N-terminal asparagine amidohydrolase isoform X2 [Cryptomeria japonica]|uniref:protein N-terminal asparagine amidohydrolase isoform X2 n=1 Tax=Cryptomeria japonica TaxID=3369 RepID=UPI0027DA44E8|nr:protein N-terminal asparagine amidohydrolase isoform X2 [Cryptomeria japonica]
MIFVEGKKISEDSSMTKGHQLVLNLLQNPILSAKTNAFKSLSETTIMLPQDPKSVGSESSSSVKSVYVFQREYATVNPSAVKSVGTDEATTCVGLAISNRTTRMTSVAHFDSAERVKLGLLQMLAGVVCGEKDADLDVHLVGGFDDTRERHFNKIFKIENCVTNNAHNCDGTLIMDQYKEKLVLDGYSWPLCLKIVETLQSMPHNFHLQTFCVLNHNTLAGPKGQACPMITGFVVNTVTGNVMPASFDKSARCPDEVVRRLRVSFSFEDSTWEGRLLETYDTYSDRFVIAPCKWRPTWKYYAAELLELSDSELLLQCSTSPDAESLDFVESERRMLAYLLKNPNWTCTFPNGQPRIFTRTDKGDWVKSGLRHGK